VSSRFVSLAERRRSLVRLLVALLVVRIVVTIAELLEASVSVVGLIVTVLLGIECWRAWSVAKVGANSGAAAEAPARTSRADRILMPAERWGPAALYVFGALFAIAYVVLLVSGEPRLDLVYAAEIAREILLFVVIAVLLLGRSSIKAEDARASRTSTPGRPGTG
jgi:ABC-type polysaccharide/polyol phosphate export permease